MEYKLVPVEPTREMIEAAQRTQEGFVDDVYKAMLAAAPSPSWIETAERLPTREDADEIGNLYVSDTHDVYQIAYYNVRPEECTHWMPKPRQTPPDPPTAAPVSPSSCDHTQPAPTAEPGSK